MATTIDERTIDTSFLGENLLDGFDRDPWEDFIDFDGNQGHMKTGQSSFPSNKSNKGSSSLKEYNNPPTTHVCEPVYSSRFPVDDLECLESVRILNLSRN